jgi:hypothetical protein
MDGRSALTGVPGRGDLNLEQILDMFVAIAKIPGDPGYLEPILDAALDGLRPAGTG